MLPEIRLAAFALLLTACSAPSSPRPAAPVSEHPVAVLVPPDATSVVAWEPTELPTLAMLDQPPDTLACWPALEQRLEATYQIFLPPADSFTILVGDLPRAETERCVADTLLFHDLAGEDSVAREGELTVIGAKFGKVYAGWRGRFVVVGRREVVMRALASRTTAPMWRDRLAALPPPAADHAMAAVGVDPVFGRILGVPTIHWKLVVDSPSRPWPERVSYKDPLDALERATQPGGPPSAAPRPEPSGRFHGSLELHYASAQDAERAAGAIADGRFGLPLEEHLGAALARLHRTVLAASLTLTFDQDSFADVRLEELTDWLTRAQQTKPTR